MERTMERDMGRRGGEGGKREVVMRVRFNELLSHGCVKQFVDLGSGPEIKEIGVQSSEQTGVSKESRKKAKKIMGGPSVDRSLINKATSSDSSPTPGYLYNDLRSKY
jgi:hypothetical protein